MYNLTREELKDLLDKAFEEGFCSYRELKESFIDNLLEEATINIKDDKVESWKNGTAEITFGQNPVFNWTNDTNDVKLTVENNEIIFTPNPDFNWASFNNLKE